MVAVTASHVYDTRLNMYDEIPDLDNQAHETSSCYLQPSITYAPNATTFNPYQNLDKSTMNKYRK